MSATGVEGRTVLVTGASRNLGSEIARTFAELGARVVVNCRSSIEEAAAVVASLPGAGHLLAIGDAGTPDGVDSVASRIEQETGAGPDVLVNNAGPFSMVPYRQLDPAEFDEIWRSNVVSAYLLARRVTPAMSARGWGRIVNLSAGSAYVRDHSVYTLAKEAMITLTEQLALELGPSITVNCVAPGQILESAGEMAAIDPSFVPRAVARAPLGRLVTRREVAQVVASLCTDTFDTVTGVTIAVDGGARLARS